MADSEEVDEEKGRQLLSHVERLIASDAVLLETVRKCEGEAETRSPEAYQNKDTRRDLVARELVRTYSNRAAIAGSATALPALIPGIGTAASLAGTLVELAYILKTEVELCLSIAHVYGFDIGNPRERQLAFLVAAVGTHDSTSKQSFFGDVVRAEAVAIWNYGPRMLARLLIKALALLALSSVWRGFLKAIPVVGFVVGGGMNKVMTQRVGERATTDFRTRRELLRAEPTVKAGKPLAPPKKPAAAKKPRRKRPPAKGAG